jgi:hypothetical protein
MPTSRFMPRVRLVEDTLSWLWHFTLTLLSDGEDWLVVSAVGASCLWRGSHAKRWTQEADQHPRSPVGSAGAAIGLIAALISILTEWLASIKLGYCTSGWWLKEKFCCLGADDGADGSTCADYHEWGGGGPVAWFVYVTCAVSRPAHPAAACRLRGPAADRGRCVYSRSGSLLRQPTSSRLSRLTRRAPASPRSSASSAASVRPILLREPDPALATERLEPALIL